MDLCSGYGMWLATTGFRTCSPPISGCRRRDILASERDGTTLVLSKAIVELQTSDFYSPHHVFSSGIGIGDSLIRKGVASSVVNFSDLIQQDCVIFQLLVIRKYY